MERCNKQPSKKVLVKHKFVLIGQVAFSRTGFTAVGGHHQRFNTLNLALWRKTKSGF